MQIPFLAAVLCACAPVGVVVAETVVVNDQVQVLEAKEQPKRGSTMSEVEKQFGAPVTRHATVGGGSAQQPPITRWDYNGFSVIFERDRVIDTVATGGDSGGAANQAQPQPQS
jgi:hypothetical protein